MMAAHPPSLRALALDASVGPLAIRVFAYLAAELDYRRFRAVKLLTVAKALRARRDHIGRALRHLADHGYLDRSGRAWPGGPYLYRLNYLVDDSPHSGTPPAA